MAEALGASVKRNSDAVIVKSGCETWHGNYPPLRGVRACYEDVRDHSGSLSRETTFTGEGSLTGRPVTMIKDALEQLDVRLTPPADTFRLP